MPDLFEMSESKGVFAAAFDSLSLSPRDDDDDLEDEDLDEDELAAVEIDLPAYRIDQVEPDFGYGRRVQQKLVDVDYVAAPAAPDLGEHGLKLRMLFWFDQGNAGHGIPIRVCAAGLPILAVCNRVGKRACAS